MSLEKAGISSDDISIYVDGQDRVNISVLFSIASTNKYEIKETSNFFDDLQVNEYENIVMFVTGHGSEMGLDSKAAITPYGLVGALKETNNLEKSIIYLGQCYAGIFNYIRAGRAKDSSEPEIVLIGATNLHESLSSSTEEVFPSGNALRWIANLFLLHVFKWISEPHDIDGDNHNTIMDSYKYAGVMTNRSHKKIKSSCFVRMIDQHSEYRDYEKKVQQSTGNVHLDMQNKLSLQAAEEKYLSLLDTNYTHQECWILNSIPAQQIEI